MSINSPSRITELVIESGAPKAHLSTRATLVLGFLAGAFISPGFLLAIHVSTLIPVQWASFARRIGPGAVARNWLLVTLANLLGALFYVSCGAPSEEACEVQ